VRFSFFLTVCIGVLGTAACARPLERGEALYEGGRYVEAAETFEVTESRLPELSPDSCATFGLYRGLTYVKLGDVENARKWLAYSYSVEQKSPGMLLPEQRRLLDRGWAEVEHIAPAEGTARNPARVAAQDTTGPAVAVNTAQTAAPQTAAAKAATPPAPAVPQ
jgi:hypothetical protein